MNIILGISLILLGVVMYVWGLRDRCEAKGMEWVSMECVEKTNGL